LASNAQTAGTPVPGTPFHVRQGDVLLVAVEAIPAGAAAQKRTGRLVIAEGEATGHAHAIAEPDAREFRVGNERFVLVRSKAQLVHEEHATIELPAGAYRVVIQREYEPAPIGSPSWRRVVD
jgi:hypothetical protein